MKLASRLIRNLRNQFAAIRQGRSVDLDRIDEQAWAGAQRRADILSRLPERPSEALIREAMTALGVSRTTLFRWLKRLRKDARTSALLPRRRGPNSGMRPLTPEVLSIVERHFRGFYATRQRPTVTRFWGQIAADCRRETLPVPSIRRLRRWLARSACKVVGQSRCDRDGIIIMGQGNRI
jgi:putative transposase